MKTMIIMAVKKSHPKFNIPNFGAKHRDRVKDRWRKQRGEDNKKALKKKKAGAEPTIGYKNPDSLMHIRIDGTRQVLVHDAKEMEKAVSSSKNTEVCITIARGVGSRKRQALVQIAASKGFKVTNK
jgi:ribosomal protein L32E